MYKLVPYSRLTCSQKQFKGLLGTYEKLHLRDLLVDLLHELNNEVNQLVFQHLRRVEVSDQEWNIIALPPDVSIAASLLPGALSAYRNRFPPQDKESLRSLRQETCELVDKDMLDLIGLLDLYADAHGVDTRLDEDALVLVSSNRQRL
jgi:hypothetical protein